MCVSAGEASFNNCHKLSYFNHLSHSNVHFSLHTYSQQNQKEASLDKVSKLSLLRQTHLSILTTYLIKRELLSLLCYQIYLF